MNYLLRAIWNDVFLAIYYQMESLSHVGFINAINRDKKNLLSSGRFR